MSNAVQSVPMLSEERAQKWRNGTHATFEAIVSFIGVEAQIEDIQVSGGQPEAIGIEYVMIGIEYDIVLVWGDCYELSGTFCA